MRTQTVINSRNQHNGQGSNAGIIGGRNTCEPQKGNKSRNQQREIDMWAQTGIKSRNQIQESNPGIQTIRRDKIKESPPLPGINFRNLHHDQGSTPEIHVGHRQGQKGIGRDQIQETTHAGGNTCESQARIKSRNLHLGQGPNPGIITGREIHGGHESIHYIQHRYHDRKRDEFFLSYSSK